MKRSARRDPGPAPRMEPRGGHDAPLAIWPAAAPKRGPRPRLPRRLVNTLIVLAAAGGVMALNAPTLVSAAKSTYRSYEVNTAGYKAQSGHWETLDIPPELRVNAIHAALLRTGKVLLIAGSGNNRENFDAGTFKSLLWDPATGKFKKIYTPTDMFCSGHVVLPDGKLLIAGGTRRYEVLKGDVHGVAGVMTVKNESPNGEPFTLGKGTRLVSPTGEHYRTSADVVIPPADKQPAGDGTTTVTASQTDVWVQSLTPGDSAAIKAPTQFQIEHLDQGHGRNVYGIATELTSDKQNYWGDDKSYVFDPDTERYSRVGNLTLARWYPTLVSLADGKVLSVAGLDGFGRFINGDNEIYDPATRQWTSHPELQRTFPTYPSLFLMPNGNLFYSGSSTGYGSQDVGRDPGIWNLNDNSFQTVPGLRDPTQTETSGSVLLPPAQSQRYMIAGGGGVGDSELSTARTDLVDLTVGNPHFTPGPDLPSRVRYPSMVVTPDDKVVITGGSSGYRGSHDSNVLYCQLYDPETNGMTPMAEPSVGRNYHSGALLLPDGRIMTFGGDPLYGDADNSTPGHFEQRIEIYTPPYLFRGPRPRITSGPDTVERGATWTFGSPDGSTIRTARLVRPSAVTHVTNVEQRSIALDLAETDSGIDVTIPKSDGLVPDGWYMLFATAQDGTPSLARWVRVSGTAAPAPTAHAAKRPASRSARPKRRDSKRAHASKTSRRSISQLAARRPATAPAAISPPPAPKPRPSAPRRPHKKVTRPRPAPAAPPAPATAPPVPPAAPPLPPPPAVAVVDPAPVPPEAARPQGDHGRDGRRPWNGGNGGGGNGGGDGGDGGD